MDGNQPGIPAPGGRFYPFEMTTQRCPGSGIALSCSPLAGIEAMTESVQLHTRCYSCLGH
jgi:hypothetical protein